ncbi:MAG: hypothetical protein PHI59_03420 [Candidatus Omnitrophica bacterium]|nr:hypothetical protein [Candidatus Omnitrophota bacterium]
MNIKEDYKIRQIIPRWYPFEYAFIMGEIYTGEQPSACIWTPESYRDKEQEWLFYKQLPLALDFVGTALVSNDFSNPAAIDASKFILHNSGKVSNLAKSIAEKFLRLPEPQANFVLSTRDKCDGIISLLKKYVRDYPYNAIAWADMAFYYAVLCQNEKAEFCISVALNLAPENRFILRAAARFYLHMKNPEKALSILQTAELTKRDPWLLASEISVSEAFNFRTQNAKTAKNMLLTLDASPKDLAELYGTIGTLEMTHGANKKGKKLFKSALIDPNENTLAQAEWASQNIGLTIKLPSNVKAAFEADSRRFFYDEKYKESLEAALNWLKFQPFCSHPVEQATYIAGTCLNDFREVVRIVEKENRCLLDKNFLIKNNYIFSLASLDKIQEAEQQLSSINFGSLSEREQGIYQATKGLVEFRKGNVETGGLLYENAIKRFQKLKDERCVALATFYLAREKQRVGHDTKTMVNVVLRLAKKLGIRELLQGEKKKDST